MVTAFGNGDRESALEKTKHYINAGDFTKITTPFFSLVF